MIARPAARAAASLEDWEEGDWGAGLLKLLLLWLCPPEDAMIARPAALAAASLADKEEGEVVTADEEGGREEEEPEGGGEDAVEE